jgi:hypothetical protein
MSIVRTLEHHTIEWNRLSAEPESARKPHLEEDRREAMGSAQRLLPHVSLLAAIADGAKFSRATPQRENAGIRPLRAAVNLESRVRDDPVRRWESPN